MRKILVFVLLYTGLAFAQGAQRIGQATQNSNGFVKVVSGAAVTVCTYPACGAASIYSDVALTIPIAQPLHADSNGNYMYFVAAGNYFENVNSPGVVAQVNVISLDQITANFASPPPIGNAAPNTGQFTTLSLTGFTYPDFGFRITSFYTAPVYGRTANNVFTIVRGSIGTPDTVGDAGIFSQYIGSLGVPSAGNTPSAILGEAIAEAPGGGANVVGVMGEAVTNAKGVGNSVGGIGVFGQGIINADGDVTNNIFSWGGFFAAADFGHAYAHP